MVRGRETVADVVHRGGVGAREAGGGNLVIPIGIGRLADFRLGAADPAQRSRFAIFDDLLEEGSD